MNLHLHAWIAILSMGTALAVEEPADAKPQPPDGPAKERSAEGEKGKKNKNKDKGERGGKEGRRAVLEIWKKADTDGDGSISLAEFSAMERPSRLPEEKRLEIFKRIDKNGDGKIGPDEMPKGRPGGMPPLEQVDFDKDGRIVFSEFQKLGFVARLPEERQRAMFARMDRDGDGALTPKDRPEGHRDGKGGQDGKGPRKPNPLDMVKHHDKDGDGALSFDEFRQIPWLKDKGEDEQEDRFEEMDKNNDLKLDAADFPPPGEKREKKAPVREDG